MDVLLIVFAISMGMLVVSLILILLYEIWK